MAKLEGLQRDQKASAKRNLMRMTNDSDENLITMTFTAWAKSKAEEKKQREFEEREAALQGKLGHMKGSAGGNAKGVLGRVSQESGSGMQGNVFVHWRDHVKSELRARNMEETIKNSEAKFKTLNSKQKGNANNAAESAIQLEEQNFLMSVFMNWHMEVEVSRVVMHYSGKMQGKKQQLEQVQSMFKDFASALEQGISNTPRTEKKSNPRIKSGDKR